MPPRKRRALFRPWHAHISRAAGSSPSYTSAEAFSFAVLPSAQFRFFRVYKKRPPDPVTAFTRGRLFRKKQKQARSAPASSTVDPAYVRKEGMDARQRMRIVHEHISMWFLVTMTTPFLKMISLYVIMSIMSID